jgi:hypothetical protein
LLSALTTPIFGVVLKSDTIMALRSKHQKTLAAIFEVPIKSNIKWSDIESLFVALGGTITERKGSRIAVELIDGDGKPVTGFFHRPHPQKETDKGAVASVQQLLTIVGVTL